MGHFEPSLDVLRKRSNVISSIKILSFVCVRESEREIEREDQLECHDAVWVRKRASERAKERERARERERERGPVAGAP